jgi:hypothetical protein
MTHGLGNKKLLVFRPEHNSHGKKDVQYAFKPEAEKFVARVGPRSKIIVINNRAGMAKRRAQVLDAIKAAETEAGFFDGVAFFCHGWKSGIQLGFGTRQADELADAVQDLCDHSFTNIPLYCCSTGGAKKSKLNSPGTGDGSFADTLRDELCAAGAEYARVMGHTTVAHTTKNPFALFFDGMGSPAGGTGGYPPVGRGTKLWSTWRKALRQTDLRFRFPFMEVSEIHAELLA